ncbi:MAG: biotin/lipoyl-binding protein [Clostridia bacterium]|jgi:multidrug efflux pump subunit AcrA (membrane-fusion protein)|nr:biotin/lipoyl-binding protein [Clostridia bacterium]MCI2014344.1 biotin/lipoyl-binding protein [Clostridia bacterium]
MKKIFILLLCSTIFISMFLSGCQKSSDTNAIKSTKSVQTMVLSPTQYDVTLSYQGIVKASDTRNYFFKSSGKVSKVYIKEGQQVKKGDILASLDTTQLDFSSTNARSNLAISENSLEKTVSTYDTNIKNAKADIETLKNDISAAQSNLDLLKSNLDASNALYEIGAIAKNDLKSQKTQYESSEADFAALCAQLETAKENLEKLEKDKIIDTNTAQENITLNKNSMEQAEQNITDATLTAEADGYIAKLDISEGDSVTANSPVIISKSNTSVVSIGVSAEDYKKLSSIKKIIVDGAVTGQIDSVSMYPDESTNTYAVDITFNSDSAVMGDIVDVELVVDTINGVFVPMQSIININGVNYVYKVNEDNTVSRIAINIKEIHEDKMLVDNLSNEKIVMSGLKTLNDNDVVSEINQTESYGQNGGLND